MGLDEKILGPNEAALRAITGAATSVGTGLRGIGAGIGTALAGGSYDDVINNAANEIRNRSQQLTYEPSTEFGRQIADSNLNPLNWPGKVGHAVGGAVAASGIPGAPEIATALDTGIQMAMPVVAGKVISRGASVAKDAGGATQEAPATQSPDLQKALDDLHAKAAQGKATINDEAQQRHLEADSLPVPMKMSEGQATQDPAKISEEQNSRRDPGAAQFFNQQNADIVSNFNAIREKAAPDVTATRADEHGQNLVDSYKEMDDKAQADVNAKYQALRDANGGQFPVDGKAFANKALADLANSDVEESLPSDVKAAVMKYQNGQPMDFNRFTGMQKVLSGAAMKASRAGDGNAAHAISIVRDSLESLPLTQETAAIKPLADAARAAARARFQRIESDPAYRAAINDGAAKGEPSPLADTFVRKYVVGAPAANVAKMRQNLAGDPMAGQHLAAATIDHIKDSSINNSGNVLHSQFNKQMKSIQPKIGSLLDPESAKHINTLERVTGYTQAQPKGSYVNNSNTAVAQKAINAASSVASNVPYVGKWAAEKIQQKAQQTRLKDMLKPGAGVAK